MGGQARLRTYQVNALWCYTFGVCFPDLAKHPPKAFRHVRNHSTKLALSTEGHQPWELLKQQMKLVDFPHTDFDWGIAALFMLGLFPAHAGSCYAGAPDYNN